MEGVQADFTLTLGFPKAALVADDATHFTGRIAVLPLTDLQADATSGETLISAESVRPLLGRRAFDAHKGDFGRVGIVAGSMGLTGAAILAAEGAVQSGAGLVSLYAAEDVHPIIAAAISPEVMAKPVRSYLDALGDKRDVLAIGPGIGTYLTE